MAETNEDKNPKETKGEHLRAEVESLRSMLTRWLGFDKDEADEDKKKPADKNPKKKDE